MTGYTRHGFNQAIGRDQGRGVNIKDILQTLRNPTKIVKQTQGRTKYIGENATVVLNPEGRAVTIYGQPRGPQIWNESGVVQPFPKNSP